MPNVKTVICRSAVVSLLVLALISHASAAAKKAVDRNYKIVSWQPAKLVGGSPVLFELTAPTGAKAISAQWFGHELTFVRRVGTNSWTALAGIPIETARGKYTLQLAEDLGPGKTLNLRREVLVAKATYPKITVKVAKQYTEPDPEQLKTIAADKEVKTKILSTTGPERLWVGSFREPVSAPISDIFGTARVFNGEVQSRHQGLDFGVPTGTVVHSINRGKVILARFLYFEGNCAVIDHGQGLLSLYLHLSELRVQEGQEVGAGEVIGLSGGTGRASGPHLHLAVRWQGIYLNPAILLKMNMKD
jgi:murein DD-endopeptidase MepM/ murein hydrolase activator NlpD